MFDRFQIQNASLYLATMISYIMEISFDNNITFMSNMAPPMP